MAKNVSHPIWGYFALAGLCLVVGTVLIVLGLSAKPPPKESLKNASGDVATVVVVDVLTNEPSALAAPINAIDFTLSGESTVYRYPAEWPGYGGLYDRLAFEVRVLFDPRDLGSGKPLPVYGLQQTLPPGWESEPLSVSYESIVERQHKNATSYLEGGYILLGLTLLLSSIGVILIRANHRRRVTPKAD